VALLGLPIFLFLTLRGGAVVEGPDLDMNTNCLVLLLEVISSTTSSAIISHCSGLHSEGVTVVAVVFGGRSTTSTSSLVEEFEELFSCGVGRERLSFGVGQVGFVFAMVSVAILSRVVI